MTDESTVTIEINGVEMQAPKGAMLIEVADANEVQIPRFCYHNKLSIAANCRMCLVEVEKAPKPLPACATPVMDGMKVFTRSPKAIAAQKATMEFLLINHPLDCPICDQGGECELQDVAMGYGGDVSRFNEGKRVMPDPDLGPLIATGMTRCIHCTRCVRFGAEIAGVRELGATGRGEHTAIGTYIKSAVSSELSGNVIDVCPVGALTAKPSRYSARAWELSQRAGIAPHDCVGSNIQIHTFRGDISRVVPASNEDVNECWISDRDRFSYQGVNSKDRLKTPMLKEDGKWRECDWDTALQQTARIVQQTCEEQAPDQIGFLVSPSAATEEMYLLNRLARGLGCNNLDHRLRQGDFLNQENAPLFPWLGVNLPELEQQDMVLLLGSFVRKEQPMIAHRLRKAATAGAQIMSLNSRSFDFNFPIVHEIVTGPQDWVENLAGVVSAFYTLREKTIPTALNDLLSGVIPSESQKIIAEAFHNANQSLVLLGNQVQSHPKYAYLQILAAALCADTGVKLGYLTEGANTSGAWISGVLPHRDAGGKALESAGLNARAMLETPLKTYLLHNVEPDFDCWDPALVNQAMSEAEHVVMLTPFVDDGIKDKADVLLPIASLGESSGSFFNVEGRLQSFNGANKPVGDSRPAWKVLRVLGSLLNLEGFDYMSSQQVHQELEQILGEFGKDNQMKMDGNLDKPDEPKATIFRASGVNIYAVDGIVRRAPALQQTNDAKDVMVRICPEDAKKLGLEDAAQVLVRQGDQEASMPMSVDASIAQGCVWIPAGTKLSAKLGPMFGSVELEAD